MTFIPQNDLERSLVKAAQNPSHRPQFYRDLVKSDVFVLSADPRSDRSSGRRVLEAETTVQLRHMVSDGKQYLPFYTSIERIPVDATEVSYLGMNALDLFTMVVGTPLLLNPGWEFGKEFTVGETASIVDGTIEKPLSSRVVSAATKVVIGQPKNYPTELVAALTDFLRTRRSVKRAWLAHFHDPSQDDPPHTLIAIDAEGDFSEATTGIGIVIDSVPILDPPVDVTSSDGIAGYFETQPPFYERSLRDWRPWNR